MLKHVVSWTIYGVLHDDRDEFFIVRRVNEVSLDKVLISPLKYHHNILIQKNESNEKSKWYDEFIERKTS